ncbi:MAG: hypothetical protein HC849_09415 [Oscillatoriales cyanobacterium RU_3_3]|nr:hypothetical protein [Oscillatoriales cyanobacterium RU_3_3]NJR22000.1 hypothetical protein [Richelia sp. CSU_2_1]
MSDNKLPSSQAPSSDDSSKFDRRKMIQDNWRQARFISNATLGFIISLFLAIVASIGSIYFGKIPETSIPPASQLTFNFIKVLLVFQKHNNDRLDRLTKELKDKD